MLNKYKKIANVVLEPSLFKKLISMGFGGYLKDIGWIESYKHHKPIDAKGNPLPWVTYPFIDFIADRLNRSMEVFEYGSGNSTLWYAQKVKSVYSVEHDKVWFESIKNSVLDNVNIYYQELEYGGEYASFPSKLEKMFDIIIVDGRDRVNCLKHAINSIKENGVVVLDDSEREAYEGGSAFMCEQGFKRIDFWGISPGLFYKKCTTIFYKNENCIGI